MLEKTYNPAEIEAKHYRRWEEANAFAAQPDSTVFLRQYVISAIRANENGKAVKAAEKLLH